MTSPSIFYSWQGDLPSAASRNIIAETLEQCLPALASHPHVVESPRLDHDTQNVGGTPEIAGTIFRKIERSAVFVADVSITQKSTDACTNTKYGPNPNVLLETGYAAARLGWDRIVLVMNERFGGVSKLPFDLRNRRWPITFSVSNDAESTEELSDLLLVGSLNRSVFVFRLTTRVPRMPWLSSHRMHVDLCGALQWQPCLMMVRRRTRCFRVMISTLNK